MLFKFVLGLVKVLLVQLVYEVSKCCSGVFEIWIKVAPEPIQQVKNIGAGCTKGSQIRSKGCPSDVLKTISQKQTRDPGTFQANGYNMGPQIAMLVIFLLICFNAPPHHFWNLRLMDFPMALRQILTSFYDVFGHLRLSF